MFTTGACFLLALLAWLASKANEKDRSMYDVALDSDRIWLLVLHIRQDLKVAAFLLGGIMVLLGIIADRIH